MPSASTSEACSIVSMPARIAALMPAAPWAWAAVLTPHSRASSATAAQPSSGGCWRPPRGAAGAARRGGGRAVGVGGGPEAALAGFVGDGAQFLFGKLLLPGLGVAGDDAPGGADLAAREDG